MSKPRGKFLNQSENWEVNDWLSRNGFRETNSNRILFNDYVEEVKKYLNKESKDNLSWKSLDEYHDEKYKGSLIEFE